MKISASLYANNSKNQLDLIDELDRCLIDYFHIDFKGDEHVFTDISRIRSVSKTPIDLHIIHSNPSLFFEKIQAFNIERVAIQYEALESSIDLPIINGKWGLAITSATPINVFRSYEQTCDFILLMTTTPGVSGEKFKAINFQKIRALRQMFPDKEIFIDGGINAEISFIMRILGVNGVISGDFLVNHQSIGEGLLHLKSSVIQSRWKIEDFMIDFDNIPRVKISDVSVSNIILSIEHGNLGFTLIYDDERQFHGLVSNADVRKAMIINLDNLSDINTEDMINHKPITIQEDANITDLINVIQKANFLISFLPVIDSQNRLVGALTFQSLIQSES